ncbi:MAG: sarcosine oxidase subunit gamma family protein [Pseudomonadota bacterium]
MSEALATVSRLGPVGMITLKGDLASAALSKAVSDLAGCALPGALAVTEGRDAAVAWMAPDEVLVVLAHDAARDGVGRLAGALAAEHALVANVSEARSVFEIKGDVRAVLAKLTPADVSEATFSPGSFRRTRLAQVPVAFWMRDAETVHLICFRSVDVYVSDLLRNAAAQRA